MQRAVVLAEHAAQAFQDIGVSVNVAKTQIIVPKRFKNAKLEMNGTVVTARCAGKYLGTWQGSGALDPASRQLRTQTQAMRNAWSRKKLRLDEMSRLVTTVAHQRLVWTTAGSATNTSGWRRLIDSLDGTLCHLLRSCTAARWKKSRRPSRRIRPHGPYGERRRMVWILHQLQLYPSS